VSDSPIVSSAKLLAEPRPRLMFMLAPTSGWPSHPSSGMVRVVPVQPVPNTS
jgi:hypothetical protein